MEDVIHMTESKKGDVHIWRIHGKMDSVLSPAIEKKAVQLILEGHNKLLFDLAEVSYINSAGLRVLLSIKKQTKAARGKFMLCALRPEVLEIMKICGFDHFLEIATDEESALHQF